MLSRLGSAVGRRFLRIAPARLSRGLSDAMVAHNMAIQPRAGSPISAERLAAQTTAWGLRLNHENTFLSWGRNAIISTVAGVALVQYRKAEGRPPLAAFGLLCMGGAYMLTGSLAYVLSAVFLRHAMRLNVRDLVWIGVQATWPVCVWGVSFMCMLDEEPDWLMDVLRLARLFLPSAMHDSLYLVDAEQWLAPIARLTEVVSAHEKSRLRMLEYHKWWHLIGARVFNLDSTPPVSGENTKALHSRLADLKASCAEIRELVKLAADSPDRSVSASEVVLALSRLVDLLNMVEVLLEGDIARLYDRPLWGRIAVVSSRTEKALADELDTVRYLRRRVISVPVMPKQSMLRRESGR